MGDMTSEDNESNSEPMIRAYQLSEESSEFEEIEVESGINLQDLLDPTLIIYFIEPGKYRSFIWTGREVSVRMKFVAAQKASQVRDQISPAIRITTIDQDQESTEFQVFIGAEEEQKITYEQTGPAYEGKTEDDALLQDISREKLLLILEKISVPEGYYRDMVIEGRHLYGYQENYQEYMGQIIKERKLFSLEEKVEDGPYIAKGLVPRLIMRFNQVIAIDLLRPLSDKEKIELEEEEKKVEEFNNPAVLFQKETNKSGT